MKKIFLACLICITFFSSAQLFGQTACSVVPVDPTNTYQEVQGNFDWQNFTGSINIVTKSQSNEIVQTSVNSPFLDPGDPNVSAFYNAYNENNANTPDMLNANGWEIIQFSLGTQALPEPTPYFLLYNKYTGVLRLFTLVQYWQVPPQTTGVVIQLIFDQSINSNQSALLATASSVLPSVDNFRTGQSLSVVNFIPTSATNLWLKADFTTTYDPCTCSNPDPSNPPILDFNIYSISQGSVLTYSTITGTITSNGSIVNGTATSGTSNSDIFGGGLSALNSFSSNYTNAQTLLDALKGSSGTTSTTTNIVVTGLDSDELSSPESLLSVIGAEPEGALIGEEAVADIDPEIAIVVGAIGLIDYLVTNNGVSGGNSIASQSNSGVGTANYTATDTTRGSITTEGLVNQISVNLPGSNSNRNNAQYSPQQNSLFPYYNNPLGVFSLVETPIVEYIESSYYQPNTSNPQQNLLTESIDNFGSCSFIQSAEPWPLTSCFRFQTDVDMNVPVMRTYRVKNDLQWALNPASELQVVGIQSALTFSYPTADSNSYFIGEYVPVVSNGSIDDGNSSADNKHFFSEHVSNYANIFMGPVQLGVAPTNGYQFNIPSYLNGLYPPSIIFSNNNPQPNFESNINLYQANLDKNGIELDAYVKGSYALSNFKYRTRYTPLGCLSTNSVSLFNLYDNTPPQVYLKLVVTLRRKDGGAGTNIKDIVFVQTYNVSQQLSNTSTYNMGIVPHPSYYGGNDDPNPATEQLLADFNNLFISDMNLPSGWVNPIASIPSNVVISQPLTIYSDTIINAYNSISINAPITIVGNHTIQFLANENITINAPIYFGTTAPYIAKDTIIMKAGNTIIADPNYFISATTPYVIQSTGTGTTVNMNGTITTNTTATSNVVGLPVSCSTPVPPVTSSYLATMCGQGSTYSAKAFPNAIYPPPSLPSSRLASNSVNSANGLNLSVSPNPLTNHSTISYSLIQNDNVALTVTDVLGEPVLTLINAYQSAGNYQLDLSASSISSGMYLCVLQTSSGTVTQRVLVVK
jgi:hypothetical protein